MRITDILINDINFYAVDENGDDNGKIYRLKDGVRIKELEYLTENFDLDMLDEVKE
jgi:hypothetical protein